MADLPDAEWYVDVPADATPGANPVELLPAAAWHGWWHTQAEGDHPLIQLARRQGFVVTTRQLRTAGWLDHDLRREMRRGSWWVPGRGVASPVVIDGDDFVAIRRRHAIRSSAAALAQSDHIVSGVSGAILHGLPTMSVPKVPELMSMRPDWLGRRVASHVRHSAIDRSEVSSWFGTPVTTIARTVVDLGRHDRRTALMAADAALREARVCGADLTRALVTARGWPGVRQAREIVSLADGAAESPLESIVRLALHDDGFPPPKLQRVIAGYRVDFLWPEHRLILEADGREKYSGAALWDEKRRELALQRLGYRVERIIWSDVISGWPAMSSRLWRLIRSR